MKQRGVRLRVYATSALHILDELLLRFIYYAWWRNSNWYNFFEKASGLVYERF